DAVDLTVHRHLEQDRPEDALPVERRALDDAGAHLVHAVEHLGLARVRGLLDAVELQRLRRAATALIERGDEALTLADLGDLLVVHPPIFAKDGGAVEQAPRRPPHQAAEPNHSSSAAASASATARSAALARRTGITLSATTSVRLWVLPPARKNRRRT